MRLIKIFAGFFILFPFVTFGGGFDTSPFFSLMAVVLIIARPIKINVNIFSLFTIGFLTCLVIGNILIAFSSNALLNGLHYIFFFFSLYAFLGFNDIINNRLLLFVTIIYFLVGLTQFYLPDFGRFFVPNMRGNGKFGRGVSSLTSEPSFYGSLMCLFYIINLNFEKSRVKAITAILIIIQLFLFARSTTIILLFTLAFVLYNYHRLTRVFIFGLFILFLLYFGFDWFLDSDSRIFKLFKKTFNGGIALIIYSDESVANRIMRLIGPFRSMLINFPFFGGFSGYSNITSEVANNLDLKGFLVDKNDRVSGGVIPLFHHFGFYAIFFSYVFFKALSQSSFKGKSFLVLLLVSPVIIFNPLLVYVISRFIQKK